MKVLLSILTSIYCLNVSSQEIVNDWKELNSQTLLNDYVEHQAYAYLNFDVSTEESGDSSGVRISHNPTEAKIVIRDKASIRPPEAPLIVINQNPIVDHNILTLITLQDIKKISLLKPANGSSAIYGIHGKYGTILIEMNKWRWKKVKKKTL